jgi:hypothetical protein
LRSGNQITAQNKREAQEELKVHLSDRFDNCLPPNINNLGRIKIRFSFLGSTLQIDC